MKTTWSSEKMQRQRKFLLVLPVMVMPFVVFVMWMLGLVGPADAVGQPGRTTGLNIQLPGAAKEKDSAWNKLNYYEQADRDSAKMQQLRKQDPYFAKRKTVEQLLKEEQLNSADKEEQEVYEKIGAIHKQLSTPVPRKARSALFQQHDDQEASMSRREVDRLEQMMKRMKSPPQGEDDPELKQMNALMEKIMDVQHPQRVQQRMENKQPAKKVFAVAPNQKEEDVTTMVGNRFYSLEENTSEHYGGNGLRAMIDDNQKVQTGSVVKLQLMQPAFINGIEIAENAFVYGVARLDANRLFIHVSNVLVRQDIFPVSLEVYGPDGMEGIPVQGGDVQQATNETVDRGLQNAGIAGLNTNVASQLAGAALQTGKALLRRQHKAPVVWLTPCYEVMLNNSVNR